MSPPNSDGRLAGKVAIVTGLFTVVLSLILEYYECADKGFQVVVRASARQYRYGLLRSGARWSSQISTNLAERRWL